MDSVEARVCAIREKILDAFRPLEYVDEGHRYFLDGKELPSVSTVIHQFEHPFNTETIARNYAAKHGNTAEYWIKYWDKLSKDATTAGTAVHNFAESYVNLRFGVKEGVLPSCRDAFDGTVLTPRCPKEMAVLRFWREMNPNLHFVLAETKVFSGVGAYLQRMGKQTATEPLHLKQHFAGTFDLLMYYDDPVNPEQSGLVIFDYKTNKDLENSFSRNRNRTLYHPFSHFIEEAKSIYTLQLSCYQIPLEELGLKVLTRRLVWLRDTGQYQLVKLNDVSNTLKHIL